MKLYEKKLEQYSEKAEKLEKRIQDDTAELDRLKAEIIRMRYLSLCEAYNCNEYELAAILEEEHKQLSQFKAQNENLQNKSMEGKNERD